MFHQEINSNHNQHQFNTDQIADNIGAGGNYQPQDYQNGPTKAVNSTNGLFLAKVLAITTDGHQQPETQEQTSREIINNEFLFVEQNDVVAIEQQIDSEWFLARSDQQSGKIRIASCQLLDNDIPRALCRYMIDNQFCDLHICFASFVAQDVGDLSLTKGDIIVAVNQVNEHWMQGQVCYDGQANRWPKLTLGAQVGTFPLNHCWRIDPERVKKFCDEKLCEPPQKPPPPVFRPPPPQQSWTLAAAKPLLSAAHSSSLSSGSSSMYSTDYQSSNQPNRVPQPPTNGFNNPPPRPQQLPRQISACYKSSSEQAVTTKPSLLTSKQQDRLRGWLHTVKKKTARLSTRITASLGLISLTRDEEFERHLEGLKHIEKTIKAFIKNLSMFVEHFESFLLALQTTSENLSDFYRDKSHQMELAELRRKNKALACEHFHAFKRTVDRQVIAVASQLLQKFSGPYQLVHKRSAKLLDYDTKTKEMESCRDLEKKATLHEQYVIAKELYDRINGQLIEELPIFNQLAMDIFRECVLVLLESRRNLILSYTKQTASLLETPIMATYTASDVASTIMMSCEAPVKPPESKPNHDGDLRSMLNQVRGDSNPSSDHYASSSNRGDDQPRPHSVASQISSEFDQMAIAAREISSTPLSNVEEDQAINQISAIEPLESDQRACHDEPDAAHLPPTNGQANNMQNEIIESQFESEKADLNNGVEPIAQSEHKSKDRNKKKKKSHQVYTAIWPFAATGPNQLSIATNQSLRLIKSCDECGNPDWSLVKDKRGQLGYVPSSYIKKKD